MGSDLLTKALRVNRKTRDSREVDASLPAEKDCDDFCIDCIEKGRRVRLKRVCASEREVSFERFNPLTGEKLTGRDGSPLIQARRFSMPAHFDRWPNANEHLCEHPVRYAAFRQFAYRKNAHSLEDLGNSYIFTAIAPGGEWGPGRLPEKGALMDAFRPVGLGLGGMKDARDVQSLLSFFKKDPGLQNFQFVSTGAGLRSIPEFYFESVAKLQDMLKRAGAVGIERGALVAFLLDPNTSRQALSDPRNRYGFIDRSMPQLEGGMRGEFFACARNEEAYRGLRENCLRNGVYKSAPVTMFGKAALHPKNESRIVMTVQHASQFAANDDAWRLYPRPDGIKRATLAQQYPLGL